MPDVTPSTLLSAIGGGVITMVGSILQYQIKVNRKGQALEIGKRLLDFTIAYFEICERTGSAGDNTKQEFEREIREIHRAVQSEFQSSRGASVQLLPKKIPFGLLIARGCMAAATVFLAVLLFGALNSAAPWSEKGHVLILAVLVAAVTGAFWVAIEMFSSRRENRL
jgi:hypothetical protein